MTMVQGGAEWRRTTCVHHEDGSGVIFKQGRRLELWITEFEKYGPQVFRNLGGVNGSEEFRLSGTRGDRRLYLGFIRQGTTTEHENETGD
jgi:hypothetical protein